MDRWPVPVTAADVATDYGTARALICGAGPSVLLLPGGGATATAWSALAAELSRAYRVIAVDPVGQPGLSTSGARAVQTASDLTAWLGQVFASLGVGGVTLIGHSYGAWMALRCALDGPQRVSRLVLLDPTDCFTAMSLRYRVHAIPLVVSPSARRLSRFLAWETRGRTLDPAWLAVVSSGAALGRPKIVLPRVPRPGELAGLHVPTLVVVAGRSRAHDPGQVADRARDRLPEVRTATVAGGTHHTMPTEDVPELAGHILPFLNPGA